MSKNAKKIESGKAKIITFWSIIGLFTVAFIVILIVLFIESKPFEEYEDINEAELSLVGEELFNNKQAGDYYVYIYTSDIDNNKIATLKAEELKPIIFNYFNFVRLHSRKKNVIKIFGFDVDNYNNKTVVGKTNSNIEVSGFENFQVKESEMPMLLRVTNGEIQTRSITSYDIQKSLQTAMDIVKPVKPVSYEAIMPKKEQFFF